MRGLLLFTTVWRTITTTTPLKWIAGELPPEAVHAKDGGFVIAEARISAAGYSVGTRG